MATRAEQWRQAAATKPRTLIVGEVTADVTNVGTLLLTIEHRADLVMLNTNLDAFQAKRLMDWLKENFA